MNLPITMRCSNILGHRHKDVHSYTTKWNAIRITGLCQGYPPVTGGFRSQKVVNVGLGYFFSIPLTNSRNHTVELPVIQNNITRMCSHLIRIRTSIEPCVFTVYNLYQMSLVKALLIVKNRGCCTLSIDVFSTDNNVQLKQPQCENAEKSLMCPGTDEWSLIENWRWVFKLNQKYIHIIFFRAIGRHRYPGESLNKLLKYSTVNVKRPIFKRENTVSLTAYDMSLHLVCR